MELLLHDTILDIPSNYRPTDAYTWLKYYNLQALKLNFSDA